jgi:hypothetical protein
MTTKTEQRIFNLRQEILDYFEKHNYTLKTDINTITAKANSLNYICCCGKEKHKSYKDMLLKNCNGCNSLLLKQKPTDIDENKLPSKLENEIWIQTDGGFISSKGRACNIHYKLLDMDEKCRFFLAGKHQYATILIAKAFNIKDVDKLQGQKSNFVVRCNGEICLENIYIGTRNEIGEENGKKSKQSVNFKETLQKSVLEHSQKYSYKTIEILPYHKIFEDGNIFIDNIQKRFLVFSKVSSDEYNCYYQFVSDNKTYKVHRLICMAFHPIEGKNNYDDYKDLQVNHKDGNTLNNHKDNLEWVTSKENMQHAYDTKLNKKTRAVLQYKKNHDGTQGELIKEYESISKASKETNIKEHVIRETAKNNTVPKEFIWRYKNEEQSEEWTKKFSSKK